LLPNIHILGIQGSGKGTQSALLVEKFKVSYISSGDLFRKRAEKEDDFGKTLKEELKTGHLLSNQFLFQTVEEYLDSTTITTALLGDGVIRTIDQYRGLNSAWYQHNLDDPLLIHLILSEEEAMQRIEQRKLEQNDPSRQEHHLKYSGKLLKRNDDNPTAIRERFAMFHKMTEPVIQMFEQQHRCIHIRANQPVEKVSHQISTALLRTYPSFGTHVPN
jgi:adenylate kinase